MFRLNLLLLLLASTSQAPNHLVLRAELQHLLVHDLPRGAEEELRGGLHPREVGVKGIGLPLLLVRAVVHVSYASLNGLRRVGDQGHNLLVTTLQLRILVELLLEFGVLGAKGLDVLADGAEVGLEDPLVLGGGVLVVVAEVLVEVGGGGGGQDVAELVGRHFDGLVVADVDGGRGGGGGGRLIEQALDDEVLGADLLVLLVHVHEGGAEEELRLGLQVVEAGADNLVNVRDGAAGLEDSMDFVDGHHAVAAAGGSRGGVLSVESGRRREDVRHRLLESLLQHRVVLDLLLKHRVIGTVDLVVVAYALDLGLEELLTLGVVVLVEVADLFAEARGDDDG